MAWLSCLAQHPACLAQYPGREARPPPGLPARTGTGTREMASAGQTGQTVPQATAAVNGINLA